MDFNFVVLLDICFFRKIDFDAMIKSSRRSYLTFQYCKLLRVFRTCEKYNLFKSLCICTFRWLSFMSRPVEIWRLGTAALK